MGIATTDEQAALQRSIRQWAIEAQPVAVVRAAEPGAEAGSTATLWPGLAELGLLGIALPAELGGADGSFADLAVALEQAATELVPGPLLTTGLAGLLLARHGDPATAKRVVPRLADGSLTAAVALGPGELRAELQPDGGLLVNGQVKAVLGADPQAQLVLAAQAETGTHWFALDPHPPGLTLETAVPLDFSRPLGGITMVDVIVPADQRLPGLAPAEVSELAAVLAGAEAVGVAAWCLHTACEHARVREQFGRPIGSFQAVKHLCAQMLIDLERASAVVWDAARAADDPGQRPIASAVAGAVALNAAVRNAKTAIQVLGGIGFTWEHDAHLYLRRALATRQWLGGADRWRRQVANLSLTGTRRHLDLDRPDGARATVHDHDPKTAVIMHACTEDTAPTADGAEVAERERIRAELAELGSLDPPQQRIELADRGYLMPHWPPPYGQGASAARQLLIDEELRRAGLERPDLVVGGWALPTIIKHGTREQQDRFVRPTLRGELTWCQLFSEPEAGSDLASLRTRAERVPGGWRLTGQKVWTSNAAEADWAICLARTDPDAPRHRGISYFLVEMTGPGLTIRPLRELTGLALFNEVFLDGVFVPDHRVVGAVNEGWKLARTTLAQERVALGGGSALGEGVEQLLRLAADPDGRQGENNSVLNLDQLGALVSEGTAVSLIGLRATVDRLRAESTGRSGSETAAPAVLKLVGVQHRQAVAEAAYQLLGPDALALDPQTAPIAHEMLLTRCLSIAGGTTQILLTQAAEQLLGLPR
jgi:alkylation response protein AidB-like acyl-CoA dehydrogenase